jgi:hypothetical protein
MNKNSFVPIFIVFAIIFVLFVAGYFRVKNLSTQSSTTQTTIDPTNTLIGIWQANGSMAAGWNDRYHYYPDGNYHFYPNQMVKSNLVEKTGTWKIQNDKLILDGKSFTLEFLGTKTGDFYPSISIAGKQYWKFSNDPSSYGDEKFSE